MTASRKMLVLIVTIGLLESISAAAFSNVIVQRDRIVPLEYISYNPSLKFGAPQASQLSSPLESVVQIPAVPAVVSPCLAPCLIPSTAGEGLGPIPSTSNAKIIAYKPTVSNVPVEITNKEAARGYQYAYAVYDDNTGDKKSQIEQSDGSVVQGQYSFIQPDGIRREVVYTADDLQGFNAVVRNISPEPENPKENKAEESNPQPAPCPEPQNALSQNIEKVKSEVEQLEEPKNTQKSVETKETKNEEKSVETPKEKENPREEESRQSLESFDNTPPLLNNVISYNDIIKCLQAKIIRANGAPNPITYILIPSLQGPC